VENDAMTEPQQNVNDQMPDDGSIPDSANESAEQGARSEIASLKDQLLRALADAENTRRRATKERDDTAKYAVDKFSKEMLAVADNFSRALDAMPKESGDPAIKNLITGLEATDRQLTSALGKFGIKKIDAQGKIFDPHLHQVMMEVDDPSQPAGTILQVMQAGYMIHDRLLREALVTVAKGGPPPAPRVDTQA